MAKLKVRIALAVDPYTLEWNCVGWGGKGQDVNDEDKMGFAIDPLPGGERQYWIEAELDVVPVEAIQVTVKEGN